MQMGRKIKKEKMNENIIIVDIETSGLCRLTSQIVNIGAIHAASGDEFYIECAPDKTKDFEYNEISGQINGVTEKMFMERSKDPRTFVNQKFAVEYLEQICLNWTDSPYLCGQNFAAFDAMIMHRTLYGNFDMTWPLGYHFLDIGTLAYSVFNKPMGSRSIAEALGIEPEQDIHTGISGARQELKVVSLLFDRLKEMHSCVREV